MSESFTWFPKLTRTVERVPEEQRGTLLWALALYGTDGVEPELEYPLDMAFEALRDDIDNSVRNRSNNRGGRPPKTTVSNGETTVSGTDNHGSETGNPGSDDAEPKPSQSSTNQAKPKKERVRFAPPSVEEVRSYCSEKGYRVDAEQFVAFYESKGWKVGRNPMRSWKAACVTWDKRRHEGKGAGDASPYSDL